MKDTSNPAVTAPTIRDGETSKVSAPDIDQLKPTTGPIGTPQSGIFALGTSSVSYLEFDLHPDSEPKIGGSESSEGRDYRQRSSLLQ